MFKRILTVAVAACAFNGTSVAMAVPKATALAQSQTVQAMAQVARNHPTSAALVGASVLSIAALRATDAPLAQVATAATAGAVIGETTKKMADNFFASYLAKNFTKGSHTETLSKKVFATVICYGINQLITTAAGHLLNLKVLPGAKLQGNNFAAKNLANWFTKGMALGFLKGDYLMLQGTFK